MNIHFWLNEFVGVKNYQSRILTDDHWFSASVTHWAIMSLDFNRPTRVTTINLTNCTTTHQIYRWTVFRLLTATLILAKGETLWLWVQALLGWFFTLDNWFNWPPKSCLFSNFLFSILEMMSNLEPKSSRLSASSSSSDSDSSSSSSSSSSGSSSDSESSDDEKGRHRP